MPTRFPNGLNTGINRASVLSKFLNVPVPVGTYGVFFDDMFTMANWTANILAAPGTGTVSCNLNTAQDTDYGEFGQMMLTTSASGDLVQGYLTAGTAAGVPPDSIFVDTTAGRPMSEWILSTRVRLSSSTLGFGIGMVNSASASGGAATPLDICTGVLADGILFRKNSGSAGIMADWYVGSATGMTQTQVVSGNAAVNIAYDLTMVFEQGALNLYAVSTTAAGVKTRQSSATISNPTAQTSTLTPIITAKGPAGTNRVYVDYFLFASRLPRG